MNAASTLPTCSGSCSSSRISPCTAASALRPALKFSSRNRLRASKIFLGSGATCDTHRYRVLQLQLPLLRSPDSICRSRRPTRYRPPPTVKTQCRRGRTRPGLEELTKRQSTATQQMFKWAQAAACRTTNGQRQQLAITRLLAQGLPELRAQLAARRPLIR